MKNNSFSNNLKKIRKAQNLTQKALGEKLNLTSKAISKWESGASYPTFTQLQLLSKILNVSLDNLANNTILKNKKVFKIAITGGPCSGKSTALSHIQNEFSHKGYFVMIVPETATELILGGISPWTIDNTKNFQKYILKLQLEKEKIFENAVNHIDNYDKILLVCDRGALDGKAYCNEYEFATILEELGENEVKLKDNYDAVFHLVTAAKGAKEFYSYNNEARYETIDEAIIQDDKTLKSWLGHPHLRVIDNSTDFKTKIKRLIVEISNFLGEPEPFEIERKFLIEKPDIKKLEQLENCSKIDIIQTYLKSTESEDVRIRQRGQNGFFTYTKTVKKKINNLKRLELETRISQNEYLSLLLDCDTNKHQIRKTRYCLIYKNQHFEIDIFPFNNDKAILEIELRDENQKIEFPNFIKIIKEVTDDENYFNKNLSKNQKL